MNKKFRLISFVASLPLLLSGCKINKLLIIHLFDSSKSAVNNSTFVKEEQQVCHGIVEVANSQDLYTRIAVNYEVKAVDPEAITSREQLHKDCKQQPQPKGEGTFACPAWKLATEISDRYPNYRLVVINQIQTNESEKFCAPIIKQLTTKTASRQGKLIVIGATNDGGTSFNSQLWQTLKVLPNNSFCDQNVRYCVKID